RVGGGAVAGQFCSRPRRARAIRIHFADCGEAREDIVVHPIAHGNARPNGFHFNFLRSHAPTPSTMITHIRIVSRIAETWSYLMMRNAAINSKPMPPAQYPRSAVRRRRSQLPPWSEAECGRPKRTRSGRIYDFEVFDLDHYPGK